MSNLMVKICGMRDPSNIELITECRPDLMGFIFVRSSSRYVANLVRPDVVRALASTLTTVGVFQNQELSEVAQIVSTYGLNVAQLHGEEDARYIQELRKHSPGVKIFKAISVRSATDVTNQNNLTEVDAILFDNGSGGSGESFNWAFLSEYRGIVPFFVAGGVGTDNIVALREMGGSWPRFFGIDASSKLEDQPGIKSATKTRALIAKAKGYDT